MDLTEVTDEKIAAVEANILTNPEWDPVGAGKTLQLAEFLAKWIVAVKDYHVKRMSLLSLYNELSEVKKVFTLDNAQIEEKTKALDKDEQTLEQLKEDLDKMEHERSQVNQDKIACRDKLEKGRKLMDELAGESEMWKTDLANIGQELEELLGNVLIYAASICLLTAFHSEKRDELKHFMFEQLDSEGIAYTKSGEETLPPLFIDPTALESWRLAGLPTDTFFTENAVAIHNSPRWPLILDAEGRCLQWLRSLYKDRAIKILQEFGQTEQELMEVVEKCVSCGDVLILYDDACLFDNRLDVLYRRCCVSRPLEDGSEQEAAEIDLGGKRIPYNPQFKLFLLSRESLELDLQTRCCLVNFSFTKASLNEFFLDTVFEREKPAKRQEFLLVCSREIESLSASRRHREKIQVLLNEAEGNVLDNANLSSSLLELRKELSKSDDRVSGMRDMKRDMKSSSMKYFSAAQHATILFQTIQDLVRINHMYQYSFDWFTRVFRSSIENSNKSNNIDKRLRYLKDHLTYSLFCQVSYSLQQGDRLIFGFLLTCRLMIAEDRVPLVALEMVADLWKVVTKDDLSAVKQAPSMEFGPVPAVLQDWLPQSHWEFVNRYAKTFSEMKGFAQDLVDSHPRWRLLHEAKEPDNLPLHEPWYSRLGRFHKLVVVAVIRVDKLLELVHSFISDHIGYKFVEPVQFDLGRIFSECEPSQPILYINEEANEAKADIKRFAQEKEKSMIQLSMGVDDGIDVYQLMLDNVESGDKWILIENFENTTDIRGLLRPHITIDQDFHHGYRLWILTTSNPGFPTPELKKCAKLTSHSSLAIRESIHEAFAKGCIKEAKCWSGDRISIGGSERHLSRLLYCLAFFHASLGERCNYNAFGGLSNYPTFSKDDLTLGVNYLEMMSREFDAINYEGLHELVGDCGYVNAFMDVHDRNLLATILKNCINEKAVTSNRYRFSVAVTDFFVPNKTLYKDYIEFIKNLPSKSDFEILDLDCSCQILKDRQEAVDFIHQLYCALRGCSPYAKSDVVTTLSHLLDCVRTAIKAHDSIPLLKDGPFKWLWINELASHDKVLAVAFSALDRLNRCVQGEKVLDDLSEDLVANLEKGQVPRAWMGEDKIPNALAVANFVSVVEKRTALYKVQTNIPEVNLCSS